MGSDGSKCEQPGGLDNGPDSCAGTTSNFLAPSSTSAATLTASTVRATFKSAAIIPRWSPENGPEIAPLRREGIQVERGYYEPHSFCTFLCQRPLFLPLFPLSALSVPGIRCPRKMGRAEVLSEHLLHLFYSQISTEHDNSSATFLVSQGGSSRSAHFIIKSIFGLC